MPLFCLVAELITDMSVTSFHVSFLAKWQKNVLWRTVKFMLKMLLWIITMKISVCDAGYEAMLQQTLGIMPWTGDWCMNKLPGHLLDNLWYMLTSHCVEKMVHVFVIIIRNTEPIGFVCCHTGVAIIVSRRIFICVTSSYVMFYRCL